MKEFAENPDVSFADVNLATDQITDPYDPGKGGWQGAVMGGLGSSEHV